MGHYGFGMFGFGFWILIIILIIIILPILRNNFTPITKEENALEILKKRLAKGEITPEEYDELKKKL